MQQNTFLTGLNISSFLKRLMYTKRISNKSSIKILSSWSNLQVMSRIGNIDTVVFLLEDWDVIDATHISYMTAMSSLEDIKINCYNSVAHYTTLLMTEFFIFSFFNRDLKPYRKLINQCLWCLLVEKNSGIGDRIFICGKILSKLGALMAKERFEKFFFASKSSSN